MSDNQLFQNEEPGSGQDSDQNQEIRRIRSVLKEITGYAEHASLTGAMQGGARQAVRQYNAIVGHLRETNAIPSYLLVELEADASPDEVGVAARMLSGYLRADEEPSHGRHGRHASHGQHPPHPSFPGLPDLPDIQEMKEIGQRVRAQLEQLPEWIKGRIPPPPPAPGAPPTPDAPADGIQARLDRIGTELEEVSRRLREGSLTDEERRELTQRLSDLSREQARLEIRRDIPGVPE
ncbi:MAG: hypothetical protein KY468_14750 [Armatimonadetes bacterium]|nr:hypothetical protein [Armatimonadota bacterium]